jgi:hypothetical protein
MSVEETDAAIAVFTSTIKSAKSALEPYLTYPPRDTVVPDLEELLRRKVKAKKNMHNFNRAADRRQYNFLKKTIIKDLRKILKMQIQQIISGK